MTQQYKQIPTYGQPIEDASGNTSRVWYRFFQGMFLGDPTNAEVSITPTGSPFTYLAPGAGFLIVQGGTVSAITFTRVSSHNMGVLAGCLPMSNADQITIAYTVAPTITFVPQ